MAEQLRTLYRHRQLIATLTSRDLKARYRGSLLGFFWSLANPLLLLGVYTLVFTRFFPRPDIPSYPLFLFAGILPWAFFSGSVLESTNSIASNAGLIKKVLFPAEALPLVVVLSHLVHFALALPVLLAALLFSALSGGTTLNALVLLAPVFMMVQTVFVAGVAMILASASVLFRDLRDLVVSLLQLAFFLTPILYALTSPFISQWMRGILRLNPMTPFVVSYQSIFFGRLPSALDLMLMLVYAAVSIALGFLVFERLRDTLAEAL